MMRRFLHRTAFFLLLTLTVLPGETYAQSSAGGYAPQTLHVNVGTTLTFWSIVQNIVTFLANSIVLISTAMFVVGAVLMMASGVKEDWKQRGKDFLIGSTLGIIVVLGAYALFRTVNCFLTPGCI